MIVAFPNDFLATRSGANFYPDMHADSMPVLAGLRQAPLPDLRCYPSPVIPIRRMNTAQHPVVVIFMGVAGVGKSTVAELFAQKSGAAFFEGDHFHPPANVAKMKAGIPLTDADRAPWLVALRQIIENALRQGTLTALTCSALKVSYRQVLSADDPRVVFVHLTATPMTIANRLKNRRNHFMPASLVESQFATLEPPADAITFNGDQSPKKIVADLLQRWSLPL